MKPSAINAAVLFDAQKPRLKWEWVAGQMASERVFSDEDQEQVSKIYGPVHSRLLAQAINLGMSQEEAGKP